MTAASRPGVDPWQVPEPWLDLAPDLADLTATTRQAVTSHADAGHLPQAADLFAALQLTAPADVRVLILGQDPYPTPGHACGLAFSVPPGTAPLPPTLRSILTELAADLDVPDRPDPSGDRPWNGDLTAWARQGVLLLNRTLTVAPGSPGSHHGLGWEAVTHRVVTAVAADHAGVALLWGAHAAALAGDLAGYGWVVHATSHPSPLARYRGFTGSRPFTRANASLAAQGHPPVDWLAR